MRTTRSPAHSWLSTRIRIFCIGAFVVSLFLPTYSPETSIAAPEELREETYGFLLAEDGFLMKTSALTEQGARSAYSQGILHTVEPNESISSIAKRNFLKPETIRYVNGLREKDQVKPGQQLLILPVDGVLHTVKRGQNLQMIADLYGIDASRISAQNKIRGGYLLAGQELIIPDGKPIVSVAAKPIPTQKPPIKAPVGSGPISFPELKNYSIQPSGGIFQIPCDCFYTQYFGRAHFGVDMQHRGGSPIFATEAGTVIRADYGWNGGYGNVIEIDHGNGLVTLYAHNKTIYVQKGERVSRGQPISFMGNTGRVHGPTGIHLHLEVHVNGVKKNPMMYLQQ
ncbi:LysM peptidoglycan-binding domain-containing protein [Candidatus Peribacteria bacterium]|nr:LysM peptidoglycan-binding domain-containing protein [Candidatus Peribacteria bacterium]